MAEREKHQRHHNPNEGETRFPVTVLEYVLSGRFVHGGAFGWESRTDIDIAAEALRECDLGGFEFRFQ